MGGGEQYATSRNPVLQVLWETYGAEAVVEWGTAIMAALQQTSVLRERMPIHGVENKGTQGGVMDDNTLPSPEIAAGWLLRDMREQQECGCASPGWEPAKQLAGQPSTALQKLPYESAQEARHLFDMWQRGEGIWLLQQALHSIQEIRRSDNVSGGKGGDVMNGESTIVRRLTPL